MTLTTTHGTGRTEEPGASGSRGVGVSTDVDAEFEGFTRAHLLGLLRYATALTGDRDQGADVVQEVLVRAHARWGRIRALEHPDRCVWRMVTNEHLSWRRRWHTRSVVAVDDAVLHARAPATADPASVVADRDDVRRRLATLSRRQRTVLVLRYYEGLDDAQISDLLRLAPSTVRSAATRALAALRAGAGPQEDR